MSPTQGFIGFFLTYIISKEVKRFHVKPGSRIKDS